MEKRKVMDDNLDLREILDVLLAKKWIILCVAVIGFVFAFGYTKLRIPYQFTSSVSLYVKNATNKNAVDTINTNEITAAQQLAATCIEILQEDVVADEIGNKLMENYSMEELMPYFGFEEIGDSYKIRTRSISGKISYSTVNETELIRATATCGDPVIAADICNYIADIAPDVLIRVVGAGDVEAVGTAKIPTAPSAPNARKNAATGFVIGLILAAGFYILRFLFDNTVKSGDDAVERFNKPLIGEIPFYEFANATKVKSGLFVRLGLKKPKTDENKPRQTVLDVKVPFAVQEAYNTMRNNMMFALSTEKQNVFVVSSPSPGEGKSTTAANLCITMGETDARVLLIDADLRKPVQHKMFELTNNQGLSTVLAGMCSFDRAVHHIVKKNEKKNITLKLDVLTSGPIPPNPSQMLASENMVKFINDVKDKYDYVVIDTSPINVVSDALAFAKQTAGIILVIRQDATIYEHVEKAMSSADMFDVNLLGIVVNSVSVSGSKRGRYGAYEKYSYKYGYGYGYGYAPSANKKDGVKNG